MVEPKSWSAQNLEAAGNRENSLRQGAGGRMPNSKFLDGAVGLLRFFLSLQLAYTLKAGD